MVTHSDQLLYTSFQWALHHTTNLVPTPHGHYIAGPLPLLIDYNTYHVMLISTNSTSTGTKEKKNIKKKMS